MNYTNCCYNGGMNLDDKCLIIEEFIREYGINIDPYEDVDYLKFKMYNDIGIPLAQSIVYGLALPTTDGEQIVIETWNNLCELLKADPNGEYDNINDMIIGPEIDEEE
jgi:hypothetical protein